MTVIRDFWINLILLRSDTVEESGDYSKNDIRKPEGDCRRQGSCVDEHLTESQEEDVGEGQGDADTDVPAYTSAALL